MTKMHSNLMALLFILPAFFLASCTGIKKETPQPAAKERAVQEAMEKAEFSAASSEDKNMAPDFKLQDIYQDVYSLTSYKGRSVLLFFWTTWCPFCQKELKVLNDRYAGLVHDGLEVLAINTGESPNTVSNFVKSYNLAFRVLLDKDTAVARAYELMGIPTYLLVDKTGHIVSRTNFFPQNYKELVPE